MKLKIEICIDNDAFQDDLGDEVTSIIGDAVDMWFNPESALPTKLYDSNGNKVGELWVED